MYPERSRHQQTGAGLPVALFIITVLALLVIGMAQLQESSGKAVSLQIQSQRAFFAAESGAQVALAELVPGANCSAVSTNKTFNVSGLNGCQARLQCNALQADVTGNGNLTTVYSLTSTGQCGVGADSAERIIEVRLR